ncbi:hypothetical protein, partial [Nocardia asiatica]|uniref:hypothetical protein n=1 Tax=Nocardia asiatica TaxID=209252 RepID=UPI002455178A
MNRWQPELFQAIGESRCAGTRDRLERREGQTTSVDRARRRPGHRECRRQSSGGPARAGDERNDELSDGTIVAENAAATGAA